MNTRRLELVAFPARAMLALMEGEEAFAASVGYRAAEGLRDFFVSDEIPEEWVEPLRAKADTDDGAGGFAVVQREDGLVIGTVGFKGEVDAEGMVEVGYGIVPSYEGKGYATEAVGAVVEGALAKGEAKVVRAHTLADGAGSMRVLEKCGFVRLGEVVNPDDGVVVRWEKWG